MATGCAVAHACRVESKPGGCVRVTGILTGPHGRPPSPCDRPRAILLRMETLRTALAPDYRLERVLGTGGSATVYLARDLKHDRQVAIKVLHHELSETV